MLWKSNSSPGEHVRQQLRGAVRIEPNLPTGEQGTDPVCRVLQMFYTVRMSRVDDSGRIANADRSKLFLDFDSFFASAEQHFNPALRGKPVGVVPLDVPGTGCVAVSREAKARGVPSSISIAKARAIVPDMIFVVARPDAYVRLHHRVLATIERCVPVGKVGSIDELSCDLLPSEAAEAVALAGRIKEALAQDFSPALTCSIGIAQTELLAKIASEMNKPDGLVVLDAGDLPGRIAHLALRDIPGVSEGVSARLARAGIDTVRALWQMEAKQCRALWGNIEGERFWNALHGFPYNRPEHKKRMFGHSRMLPLDWRTPERVEDCARQLLLSAARRLRRHGGRCRRMTLSARGGGYRSERRRKSDDKRWSAEVTFAPASDDRSLLRQLGGLARRYASQIDFTPRSISVTLHGIEEQGQAQGDLLALCNRDAEITRKRSEALSSTLDILRDRFGPSAASIGMHDAIPGGYLGAKIAFGRIPDLADFNECATADGDTQFMRSIPALTA